MKLKPGLHAIGPGAIVLICERSYGRNGGFLGGGRGEKGC
jgi:hypothetical protein